MSILPDLLSNWSLTFARKRPDLAIPGSPERCLFRHVVEDADGCLWLLEQLAPGQAARRQALGQLLDGLCGRGLHGLAPYRCTTSGSFVCRDWGRSWQLSPFITGVPLVQPDYLEDAARGAALGGWMAALRRASEDLPVPEGLFRLDLPSYVDELMERLRAPRPTGPLSRAAREGRVSSQDRGVREDGDRSATQPPGPAQPHGLAHPHGPGQPHGPALWHGPGGAWPVPGMSAAGSATGPDPGASGIDLSAVHARASGILPAVAPLLEAWPLLPRALCHGDVHPVNVIWGEASGPAEHIAQAGPNGQARPNGQAGQAGLNDQAGQAAQAGQPHPVKPSWPCEPAASSGPALRAVIDWEFAGVRPALYDLANCLGCLLVEGGSLDTPFARALLDVVRSAGLLPRDQAALLPSMILASRFGWLSEWLRRRDAALLENELAFMEHLASTRLVRERRVYGCDI